MRKIVVATVGVFAFGLSSASADLGEQTTYPGLNCELWDRAASDTHLDPGGYRANGLKNTSSTLKHIACPFAKPDYDVQQSLKYGHTDEARVMMSTGDASCKLFASELASSTNWWVPVNLIQSSGNGIYTHAVSADAVDAHLYYTYAHALVFYCQLPAGEYVNNYDYRAEWSSWH
jgi:hypothetical protein